MAPPGPRFEDAMRFVGFTGEDAQRLRAAYADLHPHLPEMSDRFYASLLAHPEALKVFTGPEMVARLKGTLRQWAVEVLLDPRDEAYAAKRRRVGEMHVRIGLDQRYVVGAMGILREFLEARVKGTSDADRRATAAAVGRACDLELMLLTDAYHDAARMADLAVANERLRRVLEQAPLAVFGYDAEGRITEWNASAERLYGWRRDEILGRTVFETIVLPEDEGFVRAAIRRAYEGEALGPMDRRHRTQDGRILRMVLAHAPIHLGGADARVCEAYAFCLDVTELETLREKMVEREKRTALGTLAAGLAHEVGNPLASISAICQIIEKKGADERLGERIRTIRESIDRIDGMVRRVLEFARTRRESDEEPVAVDLAESVARVRALVALDRRVREVEILERVPPGISVRAPRAGLEQVLLNLILNAAEATGSGGSVLLQAAPRRGVVAVVVEDDGPGFDEAALHRAAEPFFTTKEDGTGLGLAISLGILERAGGSLRLANREPPARGGRVTIEIPSA